MTKTRKQELMEASEEAAIAGAKEIREFLTTYRGTDALRFKRAQMAASTLAGHVRLLASQNNLATTMLQAAKLAGLSKEDTKAMAQGAGLLTDGK